MVVSCPTCTTTYQVPEERLRGRSAQFRCETCGNTWVEAADHERRPMNLAKLVGAPDEEPDTQARRVHRGDEREQRDLFAPPAPSSVAVVDKPKPFYGFSATRNENSVLFDLNALKAAEAARISTPPPAPAPQYQQQYAQPQQYAQTQQYGESAYAQPGYNASYPPPAAAAEEIDIAAMLARGGEVRSRMQLFEPESAPANLSMSMSVPPPANTNRRIATLVAAAGGLACVLAFGVGYALKSDGNANRTAASQVAETRPLTTVTSTVVTTTSPEVPSAIPTASANAVVAGKSPAKGNGRAVSSPGRATKGRSAPRGAHPAPPAPKRKSDPCGCHGNLQCAMKCGL